MKELGLDGLAGSATYEKVTGSTLENIIEIDVAKLSKKFGLNVPEESKGLPHIYWLPKLHKNPVKFRFIIAAPNCSVKPYRQIEKYNAKSYYFSYVKTFWVIQDNENAITPSKS